MKKLVYVRAAKDTSGESYCKMFDSLEEAYVHKESGSKLVHTGPDEWYEVYEDGFCAIIKKGYLED